MGAMLAQLSKGASVEFGFPEVTRFSLILPFSIIIIFIAILFFILKGGY